PRLLVALAATALATLACVGFADAQMSIGPGGPPVVGIPKFTVNPPTVGPGTTVPGGPAGSGVPTNPTGIGGVGGTSTPTPGLTTTPTLNPTINPTPGTGGSTPPVTTTTTTPTTNTGANPNINVNPRAPDAGVARGGSDSKYSMGANPNCNSFRSFEGFGG